MKLADLDPRFVRYERKPDGVRLPHAATLDEAQGVFFDCPQCVGPKSHSILVWFRGRGVPDEAEPKARWAVSGTSALDITLSPSVHVLSCWHGFITNGEAT